MAVEIDWSSPTVTNSLNEMIVKELVQPLAKCKTQEIEFIIIFNNPRLKFDKMPAFLVTSIQWDIKIQFTLINVMVKQTSNILYLQ